MSRIWTVVRVRGEVIVSTSDYRFSHAVAAHAFAHQWSTECATAEYTVVKVEFESDSRSRHDIAAFSNGVLVWQDCGHE